MNPMESELLNLFAQGDQSAFTDEQKRELVKVLAEYLNSYAFACHIKDLLKRW